MEHAGLRRQASTFDPCLLFIFRATGSAAGAFATHSHDILGRGEPDALPKIRDYLEQRSGELRLRESSLARVGIELAQDDDFSVP